MLSRRLLRHVHSLSAKSIRTGVNQQPQQRAKHTDVQLMSGIQPTGNIHLGNYFGAIHQWVEFQNQPDLIVNNSPGDVKLDAEKCNFHPPVFQIVDLHSLTTGCDPQKLRDRIFEVLAVLLGCGIDPERCILFKQSSVPYHGHLCWILATLCTLPQLSRFPQFKEKSESFKEPPLGLYLYPVLQTADILLYKGTHVPIGDDQLAHLNMAKHIAQKFNTTFKTNLFPLPLSVSPSNPGAGRIKSLRSPDKKMSKSEQDQKSRIELMDSNDEIMRKIKKSVTDFKSEISYDPEDRPGVSNLIRIYSIISGLSQEEVCQLFVGKETSHFKQQLGEVLVEYLTPIRERITEYSNDRAYLERVLVDGANKALDIAEETVQQVHRSIGSDIANVAQCRVSRQHHQQQP